MNHKDMDVIIITLLCTHLIPFILAQVTVISLPFTYEDDFRRWLRYGTIINIVGNALLFWGAFRAVFAENPIRKIADLISMRCTFQDVGRLASTSLLCLAVSGLICVAAYIFVARANAAFARFRHRTLVSLLCIAVLAGAILGYWAAYHGDQSLAIAEICRRTTDEDAEDGADFSYVTIENDGALSLEVSGMVLSDDPDSLAAIRMDDTVLAPGDRYTCRMDADRGLNLKKAGGSTVYLSDAAGRVIDSVTLPALDRDEVYAKENGDWKVVGLYAPDSEPTPLPAPEFSAASGFYPEAFDLYLSSEDGLDIYYTLDGSVPTAAAIRYTEPIRIYDRSAEPNQLVNRKNLVTPDRWMETEAVDKAFVVRAVCVDAQGNAGEIDTQTYFIDLEKYADKNVVSLVADPEDLFGENGICITGAAYDAWYAGKQAAEENGETFDAPEPTPNYSQRGRKWERPANLQLMQSGQETLRQAVGIRVSGASSAKLARKRFSVYSRKEYSGSRWFVGDISGAGLPIHSVVLRDGFSNAFCQTLVSDRAIGTQTSLPAYVFLNGELWNFCYIQPKYSEAYLARRYDLSEDNLRCIRVNMNNMPEEDLREVLEFVMDYPREHDMSLEENYREYCESINLQSFIDFYCANIFIGNLDLSVHNNYVVWRTYVDEDVGFGNARWNWALYDLDQTIYAVKERYGYEYTYEVNSWTDTYSSDDWNTPRNQLYPYVVLKANPDFCRRFVLTFMDMVNTNFAVDTVRQKFEGWEEYTIESYEDGFFLHRAEYAVPHLAEEFALKGTTETVTLQSDDPDALIALNTISPDLSGGAWAGQYFTDYPVTVSCEDQGFDHWEIIAAGKCETLTDRVIEVPVTEGGVTIHAVFK